MQLGDLKPVAVLFIMVFGHLKGVGEKGGNWSISLHFPGARSFLRLQYPLVPGNGGWLRN